MYRSTTAGRDSGGSVGGCRAAGLQGCSRRRRCSLIRSPACGAVGSAATRHAKRLRACAVRWGYLAARLGDAPGRVPRSPGREADVVTAARFPQPLRRRRCCAVVVAGCLVLALPAAGSGYPLRGCPHPVRPRRPGHRGRRGLIAGRCLRARVTSGPGLVAAGLREGSHSPAAATGHGTPAGAQWRGSARVVRRDGMLTLVRVTVLPHHDDAHIACPCCGEPAALFRSPLRRRREWTCSTCGATGAIRIADRPAPRRRPPTRTPVDTA